jgi:hypothetical protein
MKKITSELRTKDIIDDLEILFAQRYFMSEIFNEFIDNVHINKGIKRCDERIIKKLKEL